MPGKIRILADKIDDNAKRSHRKDHYCTCGACKGDVPLSFYGYKGKTYRKQIERSLKGEEWKTYNEEGYQVYEW